MEQILQDIENMGIDIFECSFKANVAISSSDGYIGYDPNKAKTTAELATIFCHELGHFISGAFYCPENNLETKGRAEYRANKAAVHRYIPYSDLVQCFKNGIVERWELAEYFNVTEDFMELAVRMYGLVG